MTEIYEKYFGSGDIGRGRAQMMQDIEKYRLSGRDLAGLIDDLEAKGMLTKKSFTPRSKECWDEDYLIELSGGSIADYFSREYLEHFGEVADHIFRTKTPQRGKIKSVLAVGIGAVLVALAIILACRFLSAKTSSALPEVAQNEPPQSMQDNQGSSGALPEAAPNESSQSVQDNQG